jgi:hypothetical protein
VPRPSLPHGGVHLGKGEGMSFWLLTDLHTFKVTGKETNGEFTLAELTAGPELGPPPHIHRDANESFYILEGTFDFSLAGQSFTAAEDERAAARGRQASRGLPTPSQIGLCTALSHLGFDTRLPANLQGQVVRYRWHAEGIA